MRAGPHPPRHRRTRARGSRATRLAGSRGGARNRKRLLDRSARAHPRRQWLAAARNQTVCQVERMVSGLPRGAEPGDRKDPEVLAPGAAVAWQKRQLNTGRPQRLQVSTSARRPTFGELLRAEAPKALVNTCLSSQPHRDLPEVCAWVLASPELKTASQRTSPPSSTTTRRPSDSISRRRKNSFSQRS